MAKKKTEKKQDTAIFRGREYKIIEKTEHSYKLTNGVIHFYARQKDVTVK